MLSKGLHRMAPPGAAADSADAGPSLQALEDLLPSDEDLLYEEELLRNPYSLRMWWRYLEARRDAPPKRRYLLFERALKALPGSYKVRASRGAWQAAASAWCCSCGMLPKAGCSSSVVQEQQRAYGCACSTAVARVPAGAPGGGAGASHHARRHRGDE